MQAEQIILFVAAAVALADFVNELFFFHWEGESLYDFGRLWLGLDDGEF